MSWVERKTVIYQLEELPVDDEGKLAFIEPSMIRVYMPQLSHSVDIGSWCYTNRRRVSLNTVSPKFSVQEVQLNSFRPQRCSFIRGFIELLRQKSRLNYSASALTTLVREMQHFLSWCDKEFVAALDSKECYVSAVHQYTEVLIDKIRKNKIKPGTGYKEQHYIINIGRWIYDDQYGDLFRSIRKLRKSAASTKVTEKPDIETARRAYNVYKNIFEQISIFVLNVEPFPKKIELEHGHFWFFPSALHFAGPSNVMKKEFLTSKSVCYDYTNGTIRSVDEIKMLSKSCHTYDAIKLRKGRLKLMNEANRNPYHEYRIMAAKFAYYAFMMMFVANTGMNLGNVASLPWKGEYETVKEIQGFKTIKYRAYGREVSFFITNNFLSYFKKVLELRRYILKSMGIADFEYLFFSIRNKSIRILDMSLSKDIHQKLKDSFDFDDRVTTRMWRAFKSDWLIRKTDIQTASLLLQNSPATVAQRYAEGSEHEADQEMKKFFSEYRNELIISSSVTSTSVAPGQCIQSTPVALPYAPIKPDCFKPEGCLFCDKYRVHADETDYKKLLSFRYVLISTKALAHNEQHFNDLQMPVIERIDGLLKNISDSSCLSSDAVKRINMAVNQHGKLDEYWQKKLNILDDLGAF